MDLVISSKSFSLVKYQISKMFLKASSLVQDQDIISNGSISHVHLTCTIFNLALDKMFLPQMVSPFPRKRA